MAPPTLTSVQNGWNGTWTIDNRGQNGDIHEVEKNKPFTGTVQLSTNEVRFKFKGNDPDGNHTDDRLMFSLVYKGQDDDIEIWWEGKSEKNENKIPVSGASKVLLNIEEPMSGVLGVILLDGSGNNKFWKNYYGIAKKVGK